MALGPNSRLESGTGDVSPARPLKVVVVTAATGAGHNAVAGSLREALVGLGNGRIQVEVIDLLARINPGGFGRVGGLYAPIIVRFPLVWKPTYDLSDNERFWRIFRGTVGMHWFGPIAKALGNEAPHAVVCAHPVGNQIVAEGLRQMGWPAPLITVITDLGEAHAAWTAPGASLIVAPTEEVHSSLLARGASPPLKLLGLPVDRRFYADTPDRGQARREMGLTEEKFTVLLAGGREGAGDILSAAQAIAEAKLPLQLIVACGRNEALRQELRSRRLSVSQRVIGFNDNMPLLVKAADVVIGKAGALTVGEAVAAKRPIIVFRPLPGQEQGNTEFVRRHRIGVIASRLESVVETLEEWMANPSELRALVANANHYRRMWSEAAEAVAETTLAAINRKEMARC